jgi:small subunit ribosomal protein S3
VRLRAEYSTNNISIYLYIPEVHLMLGENSEKLNKIIKDIYKVINDDRIAVKINLIEVKKIYTHAQSVANLIAEQLGKRIFSGMVLRNTLSKLLLERGEVKGSKLQIKGRLDGSEIAQTKKVIQGKMPLSTIDSNIEVGETEVVISCGKIGIKVLVYKGKI